MLKTFGKGYSMRYLILMFVIGVLLQSNKAQLFAGEPSSTFPFDKELEKVLSTVNDAPSFRSAIDRWKTSPTYLRISAAKRVLLPLLQTQAKSELPPMPEIESRHDLKLINGRAAWAFEQLFALPLPPVAQLKQDNTLQVAKQLLDAFEAGAVSRGSEQEADTRTLTAKYKGKIVPGISKEAAEASIKSTQELLNDWYPIGKTLSTLEDITGITIPVQGRVGELRIDQGFGGVVFQFHVDAQGNITSVTAAHLY